MMAAPKSTVIDLVSSDDDDDDDEEEEADEEEATPPKARRRGSFGRESQSSYRTMTTEPTPAFRPPALAPAAAPRSAQMGVPPPAPGIALHDDAVGGADVFDVDDANIIDVGDMLNFDEFFEMPGEYGEDQLPSAAPRQPSPPRDGQVIVIDGEEVFIPDSPPPAREEPTWAQRQNTVDQNAIYAQETEIVTADVCLKRVLVMFPDIDHEYVVKLYKDYDSQGTETLPRGVRLEAIVDKLLSGERYPRQAKLPPKRKRKREDKMANLEAKRWQGPDREVAGPAFRGAMASILKMDFPEITNNVIMKELLSNIHLFTTYLALAKLKDTSDVNKKWSGRPAKDLTSADSLATYCGWPSMSDELEAARKHVKDLRRQRVIEDAKKWAEKENLQRAIDANETAECQACFDDLPMNRQIHCDGETAHFTCFDCATAYVKSEVGDSRCRVLCTAGCGASFARAQLHLLEDEDLLEKLEQLQQEKDIREAGLDDLEECPFCDYKAILPPIEEDFEFRCANEQCEKVSCRRCKAVSHIPMSCEEHAKEHKLSSRHKIEEAMTKALIRNCAKCKKGFIKEYGCNKMSCPSCGNLQCYVCSESLKDYKHFDQAPRGLLGTKSSKCPLYDNVEERHKREINEAETAARAEVISENPDVSEQDLEIKVSDAVKRATDERIERAGAVPGGIPPGYGGLAAAGLPLGLYLPPGMQHRFRNRANGPFAAMLNAEDEQDGMRDLARHRYRRIENNRPLEQHAANEDADRHLAMLRNRPARNVAVRPDPGHFFGVNPQALAGAMAPRAFVPPLPPPPPPPPRPPPTPPTYHPLPGGFNEDAFGGGDDGDPLALHRLMYVPPQPLAAPVPAFPTRAPPPQHAGLDPAVYNQERLRELQQRVEMLRNQTLGYWRPQEPQRLYQVPVVPLQQLQHQPLLLEQLRRLQAQTLGARQRFDDRRDGRGQVFRRGALDAQRYQGPGGWPEQN